MWWCFMNNNCEGQHHIASCIVWCIVSFNIKKADVPEVLPAYLHMYSMESFPKW